MQRDGGEGTSNQSGERRCYSCDQEGPIARFCNWNIEDIEDEAEVETTGEVKVVQ